MKKIPFALFFLSLANALMAVDKASLPPAEKEIANSADHWRLGFYDQVRRFESAEKKFKESLGKDAPADFMVGIQNSLDKVPLNKYAFKGNYTNAVKLSAAKNECESFQVAAIPYMGKELEKVTLSAGELKGKDGIIDPSCITIYREGRVKALDSVCPGAMSDQLWPDPLLENGAMSAKKTDLALFWVEIKVPKDAASGDYSGDLVLTADNEKIHVNINLHVRNFSLPDRVPFPLCVWTKNPKKGDMDFYREIFAEFLKHGIDPLNAGKDTWKPGDKDFTEFDKTVSFCLDRGQLIFELPLITEKNIDKLKPLYEHLKEKNWLDKAIIYTNCDESDEETFNKKNIPFYEEMKKRYPDLRIFAATEYHDGIDKACDIWLNDLSTAKGMDFAAKNKGRASLWTYYCGIPIRCDFFTSRDNQPLMLLERIGIEQRIPFWIAWKYGVDGIFIFAGNLGKPKKVSDDGMMWEIKQQGGWIYSGQLNGDGFIMYPPHIPSIRMKILRDGLEDYAYLMELKKVLPEIKDPELKKRAEKILAVPAEVMVDPHYFNRNPEGILNIRDEIGDILEKR